jgi:DNA (cytosine-5)-methyltransferase 1
MTLTVGSLFSGIGGLDLGLERAGMRVIWQSEIEPYACRVLKKHWPEVVNHGDIKQIDWTRVERPDVICGGYPCQPFSLSGNRKGEHDERHLWPWVKQAISELRPRYAILENVRGHLTLGGLSVIGELASIGYDAEWRVISASSVGAPHRRDRVIIVGYPNSKPQTQQELATPEALQVEPLGNAPWLRASQWPTDKPGMVGMANGLPDWVDRRRGLGNAVVPQVAEVVGRLVMHHSCS